VIFQVIGMQVLDVILPISFLFLVLTVLVSIAILRFTLDKRVRKLLPKDWSYDAITDSWFWGWGRAIVFGWCAILKRSENSEYIKYSYKGINIYKLANRFEKNVALTMAAIVIPLSEWFGWTTGDFWQGLGIVPGYLR